MGDCLDTHLVTSISKLMEARLFNTEHRHIKLSKMVTFVLSPTLNPSVAFRNTSHYELQLESILRTTIEDSLRLTYVDRLPLKKAGLVFLLSVTSAYVALCCILTAIVPLTIWVLRRRQQALVSLNLVGK